MGANGQGIAGAHILYVKRTAAEKRLDPPTGLGKEERRLWKAIVAAYPASHFKAGDDVLLKRFCEAAVTAEKETALLAEEGNILEGKYGPKLNPRRILVQMLTNVLNQTAVKLRICPSTRLKRTVEDQKGTLELDEKKTLRSKLMFGS